MRTSPSEPDTAPAAAPLILVTGAAEPSAVAPVGPEGGLLAMARIARRRKQAA